MHSLWIKYYIPDSFMSIWRELKIVGGMTVCDSNLVVVKVSRKMYVAVPEIQCLTVCIGSK